LKQKGINGWAEAGAKNERAKWELEGKLLPFSTFLSFSMVFFFVLFCFILFQKNKMLGESI
jgi:hypothetical protein